MEILPLIDKIVTEASPRSRWLMINGIVDQHKVHQVIYWRKTHPLRRTTVDATALWPPELLLKSQQGTPVHGMIYFKREKELVGCRGVLDAMPPKDGLKLVETKNLIS